MKKIETQFLLSNVEAVLKSRGVTQHALTITLSYSNPEVQSGKVVVVHNVMVVPFADAVLMFLFDKSSSKDEFGDERRLFFPAEARLLVDD